MSLSSRLHFPKIGRRETSSRPPGLSPGSIVVDDDVHDLELRVLRYDRAELDESHPPSVDELARHLPADGDEAVVWIRVVGHGDARRLLRLGEVLDLHPLILEDIVNVDQRPKVEISGDDWLAFARACEDQPSQTPIASWQVALLLRRGLVITFEERPSAVFEPVAERIRSRQPRLRSRGADYLAYALLDALVDRYLALQARYRDALDAMEEGILEDHGEFDLQALHRVRRDLLRVDRICKPLRDVVAAARQEHEEGVGFGAAVRDPYLADCLDHAVRVASQAEGLRDVASSLLDLHLSMVGHRTNEVMKVLTMVGTIFIPLSFLAGLYGMNFDTSSPWNLPELGWKFGYPVLLGVMFSVATGLLVFFRRRGWL